MEVTEMVMKRINTWDRKILTHRPAVEEGTWRKRTKQEF